MQLIKVRILKGNVPSAKTYVYKTADDSIAVDDIVDVTVWKSKATAVVVETNVSEADAGYPISGIKEIIGKVEFKDESGTGK